MDKKIILGGGFIAACVVAIFLYRTSKNNQDTMAGIESASSVPSAPLATYAPAVSEYQPVVSSYNPTSSAPTSQAAPIFASVSPMVPDPAPVQQVTASIAPIQNSSAAAIQPQAPSNPLNDVISRDYQVLFGRPAEQAGLDYWGGLVRNGTFTVASVGEAIAKGAQNADIVAEKARFGNAYIK